MTARMIQRGLHTARSCLLARVPRRANPGLGYQLQQLQEHPAKTPEANEDYADLESDFMGVQKTHRQYEKEQQQQRDRIRQFMIKHKYFRDSKLPNLLLHAEKEQMRLLHGRDPEEWNVERLAESFPATPEIVQKILRAKWRPRSVQRIRSHDETVIQNWKLLKAGKGDFNIPHALLQHLQKFAERRHKDLKELKPHDWPTKQQLPTPQGNEFRKLLGSTSSTTEELPPPQIPSGYEPPPSAAEDETYLLDKIRNKKKMRLQDLKDQKLVESAPKVPDELQRPIENPSGTGFLPSFVPKFESSEIVISAADQRKYEITQVKTRIVIPRKLHREGATYRVEDAYYDDDGELLYRVPGMTGAKGGN
ncbi:neugrin [Drosophila eugracilis]|uniref:neugrin n=1 Tax=Drosophila eugracilis TaxID=29029 RepID=UPI001BDAB533|nr:neugrin [Drosophila eugracilis]